MHLSPLFALALLLSPAGLGQTAPHCDTWTTGGGLARNISTTCTGPGGTFYGETCSTGGGQLLCQTLTPPAPPPTVAEIRAAQQQGPPIPGRGGPRWEGDTEYTPRP